MVLVRRAALLASGLLLAHAMSAAAQPPTYHLHKEASLINTSYKRLELAARGTSPDRGAPRTH